MVVTVKKIFQLASPTFYSSSLITHHSKGSSAKQFPPMYLIFAWRYFKAKKSTNAINIISWVSVLAIAVGTASLIILLSVFNGFEDIVKSLYADFYTDLKIIPARGKIITVSEQQIAKLR